MDTSLDVREATPFQNPTDIVLSGNTTVASTARFALRVFQTAAGFTLTIPAKRTSFVFNAGAFAFTIAGTGMASQTVGPSEHLIICWDTTNEVHKVLRASFVIDQSVSTTSLNPVTNKAITEFAASQGGASGKQLVRKANGVSVATYSLASATTAAQRGTTLVTAINELTTGQTLEYFGADDFEIDSYSFTLKNNVLIEMPNATLRKPATSTSQYMMRFHKIRNCKFVFGVVDINAQNTAIASRDTAFQLGGGFNNVLKCKDIINARRPWTAWNNATNYAVGAGVYYGAFNTSGANMQWYYATQANVNTPPVEGGNAQWTEKASAAIEMDVYFLWSSTASYVAGDIRWYAQAYWKATGTPTVGVAPGEGVANWTLAGDDAPVGWDIEVCMHNPGQKGVRLGGDATTLRGRFSQDPAQEMNIPQTHTAFDYWRSGGRLNIQDVIMQDITAEAGTDQNILKDMQVDGLMCIFSTTRGSNTTSIKMQCQEFFKGKRMYVINPVNNNRTAFKITVQTARSYIEDSAFSGWIGLNGDNMYERCYFGHLDNAVSDMFYALVDSRNLTLIDCDIVGCTNAINLESTDADPWADDNIRVILDNVRCTNVTNLFDDVKRADKIWARNVTGYTNLCPKVIGWDVRMNCAGLNPYEFYGAGPPTGGYSLKGTVVWNTGAGTTKYWICTQSGFDVIGALPANGSAVLKGAHYTSGSDILVCTTAGNVGTTAQFTRVYASQVSSLWTAV